MTLFEILLSIYTFGVTFCLIMACTISPYFEDKIHPYTEQQAVFIGSVASLIWFVSIPLIVIVYIGHVLSRSKPSDKEVAHSGRHRR